MKVLILAGILSLSAMANQSPKFDNKKLFIKVSEGKSLPTSALIENAKHLFGNTYIVTTSNAKKLQDELSNNNNILKTEKNYYAGGKDLPKVETVKMDQMPKGNYNAFNDPRVNRVWAFSDASKNGVSVNQSYLSPLNIQKEEIIVAVVDTGVDYNHEDLKDVMWINKGEIPNNDVDDDNNGYIDDVYGIDTLNKYPNGDATGDPMASHAHGTHVAGTIAATQNNNIGIAGIASNVKIMAIRTVPDRSDETDADVVESFLYAAKHGAKIINCSFGKNHNEGGTIVNETINHIGETYGTLVIAAAGNDYGRDIDTRRTYPASFDSDYLMVVASTTSGGSLSYFSNVGAKSVDIAAPGSRVYSTTPGNSYGNMSGTSMAAPTAAGVAAEVLSHYPHLSPVDLKKLLMKTVTPVSKFRGKLISGGRIDLYKALNAK